jgi:hypothetical protein
VRSRETDVTVLVRASDGNEGSGACRLIQQSQPCPILTGLAWELRLACRHKPSVPRKTGGFFTTCIHFGKQTLRVDWTSPQNMPLPSKKCTKQARNRPLMIAALVHCRTLTRHAALARVLIFVVPAFIKASPAVRPKASSNQ